MTPSFYLPVVASILLAPLTLVAEDTYFIQWPNMKEWTPPVEKEIELVEAEVKQVHHQTQGGRHVCIEECEPPIEEPQVVDAALANHETYQTEEAIPQTVLDENVKLTEATYTQVSATVYFEGEKPFSRVRVRCGEDVVEAWSSLHFAELAGGISHYKARGIEYYSFISHGIEQHISASEAGCPVHRDKLNRDKARFLVVGEQQEDCTALEALRGLHKLYNKERETLKAAYAVRIENQRKAEVWRKTNPTKPKDITIRFWKRKPNIQNK